MQEIFKQSSVKFRPYSAYLYSQRLEKIKYFIFNFNKMNTNQFFHLILIVSTNFLHVQALENDTVLNDLDNIQLKLWQSLNKNIELIVNNVNKEFSELNQKLDANGKSLKKQLELIETKFTNLENQTNAKFEKLENMLKHQNVENQNVIESFELKINEKFGQLQNVTAERENFENQITEAFQIIENEFESENNQILLHSKLNENSFKELKSSMQTLKRNTESAIPTDCSQANLYNCQNSKCYIHNKIYGPQAFWVACDQQIDNGGWTIIQRRINGTVNFDRNWQGYKVGFGNIDGEFWLGLDKMHALTSTQNMELQIILRDFNDTEKFANYNSFKIGNETEKYALKVIGDYTGNAGNALAYHLGFKFTTKNQDNDPYTETNCANNHWGGWWYNKCATCKLNGKYYHNVEDEELLSLESGISWNGFHDWKNSMKYVQMMIRPRKNDQILMQKYIFS